MSSHQSAFSVRLFYSYCHADAQYRASMEKSLALLEKQKLLKRWSDQSILPGQKISEKVRAAMNKADIMVFLLSQNFIASNECMKEWEYAKQLVDEGKFLFRIPIILADCAWQDLLDSNDIKALPNDGKAVTRFTDDNVAWQEVYKGIKSVIDQLRNNFTPKPEFLKEMEETEFLSQKHIKLQDIFIFLPLSCYTPQKKDDQVLEETVTNEEQLLKKKLVLIHGEDMSGKTALGRHLFLFLDKRSVPVLYMDLKQVSGNPRERIFRDTYSRQFNGDYSLWKKQNDKTLILDNLSSAPNLINFAVFAKDFFDRIVITLPSDIFISYFRDETRLADFCEMKIEPMTHRQQEKLIKKRLALSEQDKPVTDGFIDQVENRVNSIIIANKIVPRYPFYVLSILQTYEGYMPSNLSITSYGHCYYVLILANLVKAGISRSDDDINACFHFAENLAFSIYQHKKQRIDFDGFVAEYREKFIISSSILNRLKHCDYGIITKDGIFKTTYMHYFFLGSFLSKDRKKHQAVIETMCEGSYVSSNYLTLLFIIHHTNDNQIIDDILLGSMCTLDVVHPAILNHEETKRFGRILADLSKNVLSSDSVDEERGRERDARDISEHQVGTEGETEQTGDENPVNDIYRIFKNNEILGQILRNKYGSLEKTKIEEIVETIADSGLRLVNFALKDEKEIAGFARYVQKKYPKSDIHRIENIIRTFSFLWTMVNVEKIVSAVNHPNIREVVNEVVCRKSTPAYDLIGYFSRLDSTKELTEKVKQNLSILLKKHDDRFLKGVLSIRTQRYMNTHRNKTSIEQSVYSLLGIKYSKKYRPSK